MAVTFVNSTAPVFGGAVTNPTATSGLPTGTVSGDRVYLFAVSKPAGTAPTLSDTNWTLINSSNLGSIQVTLWKRNYDGVWTMPVVTVVGTTTTGSLAVSATSYRPGTGLAIQESFTTGVDTTSATTFSTPGATNLNLTTNDHLVAFSGVTANATATAPSLSATGVSIGTIVERSDAGTGNGADCGLNVHTVNIVSGRSTSAPQHGLTLSAASTGATIYLRVWDRNSRLRYNDSVNPSCINDTTGWYGTTVTRQTALTGPPRSTGASIVYPTTAFGNSIAGGAAQNTSGYVAGDRVSVVGWVRTNVARSFETKLSFYNGATFVSAVLGPVITPPVNTFQEVKFVVTIPTGLAVWQSLHFHVDAHTTGTAATTFTLSSVRIEKIDDAAITYADGDTSGWLWDGTVGGTPSGQQSAGSVPKVGTDSAALTESASLVQSQFLSRTDSAALSESPASAQVISSASDSANLTEASSLIQVATLSSSDSFVLTEQSSRVATESRSTSDSFTLGEISALERASALADSAALAEATTLALTSALSDAGALQEASQLLTLRAIDAADTAALSELSSLAITIFKSSTDSFALLEAQSSLLSTLGQDSFSLSEQSVTTQGQSRVDSASLTEASQLVILQTVVSSDNFTFSDTSASVLTVFVSRTDSAALAETAALGGMVTRASSDAFALTETTSLRVTAARNDSFSLTEQVVNLVASLTRTDSALLTEIVSQRVTQSRTDAFSFTNNSLLEDITVQLPDIIHATISTRNTLNVDVTTTNKITVTLIPGNTIRVDVDTKRIYGSVDTVQRGGNASVVVSHGGSVSTKQFYAELTKEAGEGQA